MRKVCILSRAGTGIGRAGDVGMNAGSPLMQARKIYITEFDKKRLEELMEVATEVGGPARNDLASLARELDRAHIVLSKDVPATW